MTAQSVGGFEVSWSTTPKVPRQVRHPWPWTQAWDCYTHEPSKLLHCPVHAPYFSLNN